MHLFFFSTPPCIPALPPEMKFTFAAGSLKWQLSLRGRQIPVAGAGPGSAARASDTRLAGTAMGKVRLAGEPWAAAVGCQPGLSSAGNTRKGGSNY